MNAKDVIRQVIEFGDMMHAGQFVPVRRRLGKPPLF